MFSISGLHRWSGVKELIANRGPAQDHIWQGMESQLTIHGMPWSLSTGHSKLS